jgi:hypothetical protein
MLKGRASFREQSTHPAELCASKDSQTAQMMENGGSITEIVLGVVHFKTY